MSARSAPPSDDPVACADRAVTELAHLLLREHGPQAVVDRVAHLGQELTSGSDGASCSLLAEGRPIATGRTTPCLADAEAGWFERGEGPGPAAVSARSPVVSGDIAGDWPSAGDDPPLVARSVIALPLVREDAVVGVLSCYARQPHAFAALRLGPLRPFLAQVTTVLSNAQAYADAIALSEQLREALASRAVIEQAKGAIMGRRRVSADTAFELLRRSSQRRNMKLRDVAQEVVDSTRPNS